MNLRAAVPLAAAIVATALAPPATAQQATASAADSVYAAARRLVDRGEGAAGRALVDSLVQAARPSSDAHAQALFWRATLAIDGAAARRDYLQVVIEHPFSTVAADALLGLAQMELTQRDSARARGRLERLVLEHPASKAAGEAWFFLGVARRGAGDLAGSCAAFDSARSVLAETDIERRNRIEYEARPCRGLDRTAPRDSARALPPDSAAAAPTQWSAQVAALRTEAEASRLAEQLKTRGYDARVEFVSPFHRVRIGRFTARADAEALVRRLGQQRIEAIVVEAVRREP